MTEERRGHSRARNRGVEAGAGEVLAFTDGDCVVATTWLRELVGGLDGDAAAVAGEIVAYPPATPVERYTAIRGGDKLVVLCRPHSLKRLEVEAGS